MSNQPKTVYVVRRTSKTLAVSIDEATITRTTPKRIYFEDVITLYGRRDLYADYVSKDEKGVFTDRKKALEWGQELAQKSYDYFKYMAEQRGNEELAMKMLGMSS